MSTVDSIFQAYLRRVEELSSSLPSGQRVELVRNIGEHLREATASGHAADTASARLVLERLGPPETIVEAAAEDEAYDRGGTIRRPLLSHGTKAFLLLTVGSFIPVVGWAWGVAMVWGSDRWRRRDKWIALLVIPGGPLAALVVAGWMASLTVMVCGSGISGGTDGLSGGPVTPALHNPVTCSQPALMPWVGLVVAALLIVASLAGPFLVRKNITNQPGAQDQER